MKKRKFTIKRDGPWVAALNYSLFFSFYIFFSDYALVYGSIAIILWIWAVYCFIKY